MTSYSTVVSTVSGKDTTQTYTVTTPGKDTTITYPVTVTGPGTTVTKTGDCYVSHVVEDVLESTFIRSK